jgi:hypothetical protein
MAESVLVDNGGEGRHTRRGAEGLEPGAVGTHGEDALLRGLRHDPGGKDAELVRHLEYQSRSVGQYRGALEDADLH